MQDVTFKPWTVEVTWQDGDDDDPAGYVPFAKLADGTLSWPLGAMSHPTREGAEEEGRHVRMRNGFGCSVERP